MSKSKATGAKSAADPSSPAKPAGPTWSQTLRETVESVAIAFILAFLFRTFEAEAFVIPTGSMAPTLQGRHKDVVCPQCGYEYRVGASSEVDENGDALKKNPRDPRGGDCHVIETTCPMCRYKLDVDPKELHNDAQYPSYNGDRIIVNKFAYDVSDPQRWDVVVFKFPGNSKINYIKRLVGLPNEQLRIIDGDVYTAPLNSNDFQIARKPSEKLRAMLQPVFDNDYIEPKLIEAGMVPRWQPWSANPAGSSWKTSSDYKSFAAESATPGRAWLRYQHILPTEANWEALEKHQNVVSPKPSLIKDFYAYDDGITDCSGQPRGEGDRNPVGDLALDCHLEVKKNQGAFVMQLIKGGVRFDCQIDLATGQAKLSSSALPDFAPVASTPIRGPGNYDISFSNVDRQLLLWVNGKLMEFQSPTTYDNLHNAEPVETPPIPGSEQATDLSPVGIAVDGGASVEVSHVKILRDIFYSVPAEFRKDGDNSQAVVSRIEDLEADEFFMMGDNSPASADSRYWGHVDRKLLIGKALFIYWPHSLTPSWAFTIPKIDVNVPFWPNFKRMKFVH